MIGVRGIGCGPIGSADRRETHAAARTRQAERERAEQSKPDPQGEQQAPDTKEAGR